jgi:hypothetical protein
MGMGGGTKSAQLLEALDWATAENKRQDRCVIEPAFFIEFVWISRQNISVGNRPKARAASHSASSSFLDLFGRQRPRCLDVGGPEFLQKAFAV